MRRSFHTVDACPSTVGLNIFAFKGIMVDRDREDQLNGLEAAVQQGRRNINGNNADFGVCSMTEKL